MSSSLAAPIIFYVVLGRAPRPPLPNGFVRRQDGAASDGKLNESNPVATAEPPSSSSSVAAAAPSPSPPPPQPPSPQPTPPTPLPLRPLVPLSTIVAVTLIASCYLLKPPEHDSTPAASDGSSALSLSFLLSYTSIPPPPTSGGIAFALNAVARTPPFLFPQPISRQISNHVF